MKIMGKKIIILVRKLSRLKLNAFPYVEHLSANATKMELLNESLTAQVSGYGVIFCFYLWLGSV
jgi:hypothetical protein